MRILADKNTEDYSSYNTNITSYHTIYAWCGMSCLLSVFYYLPIIIYLVILFFTNFEMKEGNRINMTFSWKG